MRQVFMRVLALSLLLGAQIAHPPSIQAQPPSEPKFLVHVTAGEKTNDVDPNEQAQPQIVAESELGGKGLKVTLMEGGSFGQRVRLKDWTQFARLRVPVFNSGDDASLEFNVVHAQSKDYETRIVVPFEIKSGKSEVTIVLGELKNTDGSQPDLAHVVRWYLAAPNGESPELVFGDFILEPEGVQAKTNKTASNKGSTKGTTKTPPKKTETDDSVPADDKPDPMVAKKTVTGESKFLVHVTVGEKTNDTDPDEQGQPEIVSESELGGKGLKITLMEGGSFGQRVRLKDWSKFARLRVPVFNSGDDVSLELNVVHDKSKDYDTRIVTPFEIKSGKNEVVIALAKLKNTDGSQPDLAHVVRWYLASPEGASPELVFGDFVLETAGAKAPSGPSATSKANTKTTAKKTDSDGGASPGVVINQKRLARIKAAKRPKLNETVQFDTPEADEILAGLEVFPPDNPWNIPVDQWPVHPNSKAIIKGIGGDKPLRYNPDMGFMLVPGNQERVDVNLTVYAEEADKGPFPVPENAIIEGWPAQYQRDPETKDLTLEDVQGGKPDPEADRHGIIVDPINRKLYEFYRLKKTDDGWTAEQASIFDLTSNALRPDGWTSADAAGLPIFPAVVRYDELKRGEIEHALRVTFAKTRREYVYPATHYASSDEDESLPRMGERFRLRKNFDTSKFSPEVKTILEALKRYGMLNADNGLDWSISVAPDERIPVLHEELRKIKGSDFEVVTPPDGYEPAR